jgi:hypothetical protein
VSRLSARFGITTRFSKHHEYITIGFARDFPECESWRGGPRGDGFDLGQNLLAISVGRWSRLATQYRHRVHESIATRRKMT